MFMNHIDIDFSKINLPNRLTILRVILIPFFVIFMLLSTGGGSIEDVGVQSLDSFVAWRIISVLVFLGACVTDFLDGYIAREYALETTFGKFMDPLADKVLVCSALVLFSSEGSLAAWVVIIIIAREFTISAFRLVAVDKGIVIAAGYLGKAKTFFQMILCVILILPGLSLFLGSVIMGILIALVLILTVASLIEYIYKNITVITSDSF